jgi:hypothetical protein
MKSFLKNSVPICRYIIYPIELLRSLELESWFAANTINWLFMIICAAMVYWVLQLKLHDDGEENQDTTALFFQISTAQT